MCETHNAQRGKIMGKVKRFFKELKRVRWPSAKESSSLFVKVLLFVGISSLILFALAIGLTALWNDLGVGING